MANYELSEIETWRDIKDAEISPTELDYMANIEYIKDEINLVFENIEKQLLDGTDVNIFYFVRPEYYLNHIHDDEIKRVVKEFYASKLKRIYDDILLSYFNLTFYNPESDFDLIRNTDYFEVFYSLHYGRRAVNDFHTQIDTERILGFIRLDNCLMVKSLILGFYDAKLFQIREVIDNLKQLIKVQKNENSAPTEELIQKEILKYSKYLDIIQDWRDSIGMSYEEDVCDFYRTYLMGSGAP